MKFSILHWLFLKHVSGVTDLTAIRQRCEQQGTDSNISPLLHASCLCGPVHGLRLPVCPQVSCDHGIKLLFGDNAFFDLLIIASPTPASFWVWYPYTISFVRSRPLLKVWEDLCFTSLFCSPTAILEHFSPQKRKATACVSYTLPLMQRSLAFPLSLPPFLCPSPDSHTTHTFLTNASECILQIFPPKYSNICQLWVGAISSIIIVQLSLFKI